MTSREITEVDEREKFNKLALHPLQSWEWGEFRKSTGVKVIRYGIYKNGRLAEPLQITIHSIPHTGWTIGYLPKGYLPTKEQVMILRRVAKENGCIYVKVEPKAEKAKDIAKLGFVSGRPLFTKYNFVLDVTPSEEELLKAMKQKTRYNIRVAEKKGVTVELDDSPTALNRYLALTEETTKRQKFYAHSRDYHQKMWESLHPAGIAHLLVAKYRGEVITTWILFKFGDTLYYPYGASTREYREVMANNLVMWEAIKLAKSWGLKYLDMWGALGPTPNPRDPWFGFHTFKAGYGAKQVEYVGTWDYVARPALYRIYRLAEWVRWKILRLR